MFYATMVLRHPPFVSRPRKTLKSFVCSWRRSSTFASHLGFFGKCVKKKAWKNDFTLVIENSNNLVCTKTQNRVKFLFVESDVFSSKNTISVLLGQNIWTTPQKSWDQPLKECFSSSLSSLLILISLILEAFSCVDESEKVSIWLNSREFQLQSWSFLEFR